MKCLRLSLLLGLACVTVRADAGEILVGGWFNPGFATGYVNGDYTQYGDTSGMQYGTLVDFSSSALVGGLLKTLTFTSPVYGAQSVSFTNTSYLTFTPFGEFYQETNALGDWLDVNIPYTGVSPSFSFKDYASVPVTPPPITPPPCLACDPPPVVTVPETSTWLMLALGFFGLGGLRLRRHVRQSISV